MEEFEVVVVDFAAVGSEQIIKSKLTYDEATHLAEILNQTTPRPYKYIIKRKND